MQKQKRNYLIIACVILLCLLIFYLKCIKEGFDNNVNYIEGVDIIYWINLDRSPDRRALMENLLTDKSFNDIPNERIVAYDGKNDSTKVFSKLNVKTHPRKKTNSEYACLLSHLEAIRKFNESDKKVALIFEDDVTLEFQKYWNTSIKDIIKSAPSNWDIILLNYIYGSENSKFYNWKTGDNYDMVTKNNYYSCLSYIINKNGSAKIMKDYKKGIYTLSSDTTHVSDIYLFQKTNSYAYKYPMFTYKTLNDSTIHDSHIDYNKNSKLRIIHNYNNMSDATKQKK